jgi:DNA-binding NtrC family response regulator/predicted negative regulator of RcsB-dependent stress response
VIESVAAEARAAGDRACEAEAIVWLVLVAWRTADLAHAEKLGREALEILSGPPSLALARAHRYVAIVFGVQRRYGEALEHHRQAIEVYRTLRYPLGYGREYLSLALHYLDMGEFELAELYMRKGLGVAESCEDRTLTSLALSRLGMLALSRNQPQEALYHFQRDLDLTRRTESPRNLAFPLRNVGRALVASGRPEAALASLKESAEAFEQVGDKVNLAITLLDQAIAECDIPKLAGAALQHAQRGRELLEASRRTHVLPLADLAEARALLRKGEVEAADKLFLRAIEAWSTSRNKARVAEACLSFGTALAQAGDKARAMRCFQQALDLAVRGGQTDLTSRLLARIDELEPDAAVPRPLRAEGEELSPDDVARPATADEIVGRSPAIAEVRRLIEKVAPRNVPVLITGESGVGKELVARAVHGNSPRRDRPLVVVNCGAIPAELVESELFGHVRGAFTGAVRDSPGKFVAADGGTLFLDEVGDLPLAAQVKLLRFLQTGEVHTVGDSSARPKRVSVRVVAATHRDLEQMAAERRFRHDLYFRLNVFPIYVPPLRERLEDVPALVRRLLQVEPQLVEMGIRGVSPAAMSALSKHEWSGNVRELQSALIRAAVLTTGDTITAQDLPDALTGRTASGARPGRFQTLEELERDHVRRALELAGGNQSQAARMLGVHRNTLRKHAGRR